MPEQPAAYLLILFGTGLIATGLIGAFWPGKGAPPSRTERTIQIIAGMVLTIAGAGFILNGVFGS